MSVGRLRAKVSGQVMLLVAVGAFFGVIPASAQTTHVVYAGNTERLFDPSTVVAAQGDTVRWEGLYHGHTVTPYAGQDGDQSIDPSGHTFSGGTLYYRCLPHSSLSWTDECEGMCAAITDKTTAPAKPVLSLPAEWQVGNPVRFEGTTDPWSRVHVYDATTSTERAEVISGADGSWHAYARFPWAGSFTVNVYASHPNGLSSESETMVIQVTEAPDVTHPSASFDQPRYYAYANSVTLTGTAQDNKEIYGVVVRVVYRHRKVSIQPLILPTFIDGYLEYEATCHNCPAANATWSVTVPGRPAALHDAWVMARDTSGNASSWGGPVTFFYAGSTPQ